MTSIWFDRSCEQIWIEGADMPFPPRTLVAVWDGDRICVRLKGRSDNVLRRPLADLTDETGTPFASVDAALAYLGQVFDRHPEPGALIEVATAYAALGGHRVVAVTASGLVNLADSDDLDTALAAVGITLGAAETGANVRIATSGTVDEPSWSFVPGPVFLGRAGALTQVPPSTGCELRIGTARDATRLVIAIQEPIALAA